MEYIQLTPHRDYESCMEWKACMHERFMHGLLPRFTCVARGLSRNVLIRRANGGSTYHYSYPSRLCCSLAVPDLTSRSSFCRCSMYIGRGAGWVWRYGQDGRVSSLSMSVANEELPTFFSWNGLSTRDAEVCLAFAAERYSDSVLKSVRYQGGCSWTLIARPLNGAVNYRTGNDVLYEWTIVQFRLEKHAIPIDIAIAASRIYSPLAPETRELGRLAVSHGMHLQAVAMSCLPGKRFSEVQPRKPDLDQPTLERYRILLQCLSTFFAKSWHSGCRYRPALSGCTGKVGKSILSRFENLGRYLPSLALRQKAREVREAVEDGGLDPLPVCLTHGDLLPSNLLVDETSWQIKGYIDWAEAEYLSCGTCLYGLEHLLGYLEQDDKGGRPRFVYYDQADKLRETFWKSYEQQVPEIEDLVVRKSLTLGRDVGILLWKGFGWDDGSIDRVVNPIDDAEELACLQAFLGLESKAARHDSFIESV